MHSEPGSSIAGRYRLERRLVDVTHVTLWRGHDTVLDRPVAVRLVSGDHPRANEVLEAARSTSRVDDRRLARVLDADVRDTPAAPADVYIVTAWPIGTDLSTLLADGPLEPDETVSLVAEVAEVVTLAHAQGIAHLALDPTNVVVGPGDDITLLGLAVDAVLRRPDAPVADPMCVDARGLGALMYACLTGRWPLDDGELHGLPAAPYVGPRLCTPRQVRAAIPAPVDVLCRRALGEVVDGHTLDTPSAVVDAVRELLDDRARTRWRPSSWFGRTTRTPAGRR